MNLAFCPSVTSETRPRNHGACRGWAHGRWDERLAKSTDSDLIFRLHLLDVRFLWLGRLCDEFVVGLFLAFHNFHHQFYSHFFNPRPSMDVSMGFSSQPCLTTPRDLKPSHWRLTQQWTFWVCRQCKLNWVCPKKCGRDRLRYPYIYKCISILDTWDKSSLGFQVVPFWCATSRFAFLSMLWSQPKLEVPTIYKAYFSGLNFREYAQHYMVQ